MSFIYNKEGIQNRYKSIDVQKEPTPPGYDLTKTVRKVEEDYSSEKCIKRLCEDRECKNSPTKHRHTTVKCL
jgi:hypothetical protein